MTDTPFCNSWFSSAQKDTVFVLSVPQLRCAGLRPVTMWVIHTAKNLVAHHLRFFADAQNNKEVLSIPTSFWSIQVELEIEYVGVKDVSPSKYPT